MIVVTGASGQLGRLVIKELLKKLPANEIVAAVRTPEKVADLAALGVQVRLADYAQPATLDAAFKGAAQLLLISSSEVGQRLPQHRNAIDAAKRAGVGLVAYTSVLRADTSPLGLAAEHKETEALLRASGLPHVVLRNGWYTENYLASVPTALQHGVYIGSAGEGKIASAARADYAAAAAAVLTGAGQAGKVYELAGDEAYTLTELAAEIARQSGKAVVYQNLPEADFKEALLGAGLPEHVAGLLSDSDAGVSKGGLFDDGHQLSRLIGRPTTTLATLVKAALA
ncbi:SDR family oxidoreductase [Collimonas sp. H4R21]|jgi:NAD(P)H dehydrogenase (quinone)|uniref:SDR family oxidoreductase n=1 Tax=Collimonas rhizosphaerae TaxID=3126357 RepID=A0ABU9Q1T0_9BURK|nr:SDR family oxidoreductase [Collimonas sp. OK412]SFD25329.1 NAD(P)H dehydrogenase (quinone) [Collimonas sp. OK412]